MEGRYKATPPTLTENELSKPVLDATGNLMVVLGGAGSASQQVVGNVAAAATDSGNPVKVGGIYSASLPTLTNGQRGNLQITAKGAALATLFTAAGVEVPFPASLGTKTAAASLAVVPASDALPPIGGAYTDRSIANLSGSSEQLMAANAARRILIVHNIGATAVAVNLTGGTASLTVGGSYGLAAGASLVIDTYPPTSAITIIGTASADVTAYEG